MKTKTLLLLLLLSATAFAQRTASGLKDLNVDFMLRGYFFAGSRIVDQNALGGFGPSNNLPVAADTGMNLPSGQIALVALPDEETVFSKEFRGIKVVLANTTDKEQGFAASDSRLYIVQEALDADGKWKPVEYLPSSWCGNSYHTVFLGPGEYWEFAAARFNGSRKTKLRFRLQMSTDKQKVSYIYSNEFEGSINPKQFTQQKPYTPAGLMDPYSN
jgi:hypothetical protein